MLLAMCMCAMAEDEKSPAAKAVEAPANPAIAGKIPSFEIGLNDKPVQLPTQVVNGGSPDHLYEDLNLAFRRQKMIASRTLYQTTLLDKIQVQAILPIEEGSNHKVALPLAGLSW
ncbi:MAG TPA: hypothetical protein VNW23_03040 [Opitutaceae bacterium]|nr:hypothetical protein [Opitutaceae bacterium]